MKIVLGLLLILSISSVAFAGTFLVSNPTNDNDLLVHALVFPIKSCVKIPTSIGLAYGIAKCGGTIDYYDDDSCSNFISTETINGECLEISEDEYAIVTDYAGNPTCDPYLSRFAIRWDICVNGVFLTHTELEVEAKFYVSGLCEGEPDIHFKEPIDACIPYTHNSNTFYFKVLGAATNIQVSFILGLVSILVIAVQLM